MLLLIWHQATNRWSILFFFMVLPDIWGIEYRQPETQIWTIDSQMHTISKATFCVSGYYSNGFLNALILAPFALAKFNLKKQQERENIVKSNYPALLWPSCLPHHEEFGG